MAITKPLSDEHKRKIIETRKRNGLHPNTLAALREANRNRDLSKTLLRPDVRAKARATLDSRILPIEERFSKFVRPCDSGCWEFTGARFPAGYGKFGLKGNTVYAHRVAWMIAHGKIPEGSWVLHSCDNKCCVNPDHLHLGDRKQNTREAVERNRVPSGERSGSRKHPERLPRGEQHRWCKLKTSEVEIIRSKVASGSSQGQMAKEFRVNRSTISRIVSGKRPAGF